MPSGVKDITDTQDSLTTGGFRLFEGYQPRIDAASVAGLQRAGGIVVGKTVTPQFTARQSDPMKNP
jgi:Asp-tRNA(Asn)/Glu-tRNA(Gln) amidotransferase A subunit family amidase